MKRLSSLLSCGALVIGLSGLARAELVFYDAFDGNHGAIDGQSSILGGTWDDPDGRWEIVPDGLSYDGLPTEGGRAEALVTGPRISNIGNSAVAALFDQEGFIYYTALFRDDGSGRPGGHGALFLTRDANADLYVAPLNDTKEPARIRAPDVHGNNGESIASLGRGGLHDGNVHLVAMRISMNADAGPDPVQVVIDPDLAAGEPDWNAAPGMDRGHKDLNNLDYNRVEISSDLTDGPVSFDEIRIGTTWEDVCCSGGELPPPPTSFTWNQNAAGDWNSVSNWDPGRGPPNGNSDAIFGGAIAADSTVFVDSPVTVRRIAFDNTNSYFVAGARSVHMATGTDSAGDVAPSINALQGSHQFQTIVNLLNNTTVDVATDTTLEFANRLNLNGNILTKTGPGNLVISNTLNTGDGSVIGAEGVISGSGTIGGDLNNENGTVSPGASGLFSDGTLSVVPEPSSVALLVLGLLVSLPWCRKSIGK